MLSLIYTLYIICQSEAPNDLATSMTPGSVSLNDVSKTLAMYGIAETVNGTMAAVVPIDLPATNLVKGIIITNKIINGKDLKTLIIKLNDS